jgi:3-methyladenine DNA glycosylase AlkD
LKINNDIKSALEFLSIPEKKEFFPKFFKAGKGEYAEGDQFIGVTVPDQRKIAKAFFNKISLNELAELLSSKFHEHRLTALLMLVLKYEKSENLKEKETIVNFYLKNKKHINHWDLVDASCYKILGRHAFETENPDLLRKLSEEENMWSKRMAIVSTMYFIRKENFDLTKELALKNLQHPHDLMHKANGWLLREMGKKNEQELLDFLEIYCKKMPRTSLRYAIERLDENLRQSFLKR